MPQVPMAARQLTLTERLLLREHWMAYRDHDRRSIRLGAPLAGLFLGAGALAFSTWAYADDRRTAGTLMTVFVTVPLLALSITVLTKRVKKRRAIEHEIWNAPPLARSPLAWTF